MKYCGNSGSLELDGSLRLFYDAVTIVNIDAARHLSSSTSIASTQPGVTNALPSQNRHEIGMKFPAIKMLGRTPMNWA